MIKSLWKENPSAKDLGIFSITIGFIGLFLLFYAYWQSVQILQILALCLLFLLVLGSLFRPFLVLFFRLWMTITQIVGAIISRLILALIFYSIFTPIGLLLKLLKKRPLDLKIEQHKKSYWQLRRQKQSDLKKMY